MLVNDEKQAEGKSVTLKLNRDMKLQPIKTETEGYKDQYLVVAQAKKSLLVLLTLVLFICPIVFGYGVKSNDSKNNWGVAENFIPVSEKGNDEKYLFVDGTTFNIGERDLKFSALKNRSYVKNKKRK